MKTVDELKDEVYVERTKYIEKEVKKALLSRLNYVEIGSYYITDQIKSEMELVGFKVESKEKDAMVAVISW